MKYKITVNSEASLLEIIISALIIAVTGIIALNCFAAARFTQIKSNDMVKAGFIAQSDIEIVKSLNSEDEMYDFLNKTYSHKSSSNDNSYVKYFDEHWNISEENKEFEMNVVISNENLKYGELKIINISAERIHKYPFINGSKQVYSIETKKYFPTGGTYGQ